MTNQLTAQSRDIGQGVDAAAADGEGTAEQGAGDQGIMFGYARDGRADACTQLCVHIAFFARWLKFVKQPT